MEQELYCLCIDSEENVSIHKEGFVPSDLEIIQSGLTAAEARLLIF